MTNNIAARLAARLDFSIKPMLYTPLPGDTIEEAANDMAQAFIGTGLGVIAEFNGIPLSFGAGVTTDMVVEQYHQESTRRRAEFEASPEGQAQRERQAEFSRIAAEAKAEGILPFSVRDRERWDADYAANKDNDYSAGVLRYIARWANYMEREIAAGKTVAEAATTTEREADKEGITGAQFGIACCILAIVWKHGDAFKAWREAAR